MDPFQRDFEDEYAIEEMIQEGTQSAACFQDNQNEDDGSQYLNDTGDGDAETGEEMHVEDGYMKFDHRIWHTYVSQTCSYIYTYI